MKTKLIKKCYILLIVSALLCLSAFFVSVINPSVFAVNASTEIKIEVDILSYDKNALPQGVVGKSYPVFNYKAVDGQGNGITDTNVFVYNPANELVPVTDMRFPTLTEGKYKIVYNASNGTNHSTFTLIVTVVPETDYVSPYYNFNDNISSAYFTGEQVALYVGDYGNGNGELSLIGELLYQGTYTAGQAVEIQNYGSYDYFVPTVSGSYTVKYTVTDIVGTKATEQKVITVTDSVKPIMNAPSLPKTVLVGEKVSLQNTEAIVYVNGMQIYVPVKVEVNGNDVTNDMCFTPEAKGEYTVKYQASNPFSSEQNGSVSYSQVINVVDTADTVENNLPYVTNFFNLNGLTAFWNDSVNTEINLQEKVFVLKASTAGNVFANFKSAISTQLATAKVGFENITQTSVINVGFTDYVNGEERLTVTFKPSAQFSDEAGNNLFELYVGGVYKSTINVYPTTFTFNIDCEARVLTLNYNKLRIKSGTTETEPVVVTEEYSISCYDNGKEFTGFGSEKLYLDLSAEQVSSSFIFKVYEICTQNVSNSTVDNTKPIIVTEDNFNVASNAEIGESFVIKPVKVFDIYDTELTLSVKVTDPSGNIIIESSIENASAFSLSQYGNYRLTYRAEDSAGNFRELKCVIMIVDRQSPEISIVDFTKTVKVGETLTLPLATVTDNVTNKVVNWIYVTDENYNKIIVYDGKKVVNREYTFEKEGTYIVKYGAIDDAGNMTVVAYAINCR